MRYSKTRNASIGCLNLTLGTRNVIWAFLFRFSFVSSASWLVLGGVMSSRCQVVIALLRIVFLCNGWLWHAILISCIRIIRLHGFFFISWASCHAKDDCYVGRTHRLLQDKLKSIVCSMFTVPNVFDAWHRATMPPQPFHHADLTAFNSPPWSRCAQLTTSISPLLAHRTTTLLTSPYPVHCTTTLLHWLHCTQLTAPPHHRTQPTAPPHPHVDFTASNSPYHHTQLIVHNSFTHKKRDEYDLVRCSRYICMYK